MTHAFGTRRAPVPATLPATVEDLEAAIGEGVAPLRAPFFHLRTAIRRFGEQRFFAELVPGLYRAAAAWQPPAGCGGAATASFTAAQVLAAAANEFLAGWPAYLLHASGPELLRLLRYFDAALAAGDSLAGRAIVFTRLDAPVAYTDWEGAAAPLCPAHARPLGQTLDAAEAGALRVCTAADAALHAPELAVAPLLLADLPPAFTGAYRVAGVRVPAGVGAEAEAREFVVVGAVDWAPPNHAGGQFLAASVRRDLQRYLTAFAGSPLAVAAACAPRDPNAADGALTALVQWAACSLAGKQELHHFPNFDELLWSNLGPVVQLMRAGRVTVGQLTRALLELPVPLAANTTVFDHLDRLCGVRTVTAPRLDQLREAAVPTTVEALERLVWQSRCTAHPPPYPSLREAVDLVGAQRFFDRILPRVLAAALEWREERRIPVLESNGHVASVEFTEAAALSLLANAFFCTLPDRVSGYRAYLPSFNFDELFTAGGAPLVKSAKLAMILEYFDTMTERLHRRREGAEQVGSDRVIAIRRHAVERVHWEDAAAPLCPVVVHKLGESLDDAQGMLKVDFANEMLGGAALSFGCVQEEIMFAHTPELILTRLVCPNMRDNEAVLVTGVCRFAAHRGYAFDLRYAGPVAPDYGAPSAVVAIDALDLRGLMGRDAQFSPHHEQRELTKAYAGFSVPGAPPQVATGNWGCGAFLGNAPLKALLQWAACSLARKQELHYFPFDNAAVAEDFGPVATALRQRGTTVGQLVTAIYQLRAQHNMFSAVARSLRLDY